MFYMAVPAYLRNIFITILFVVATINFTRTTLKVVESSRRLDELKVEVGGLEGQKEALEKELKYKKSDVFIEKEARNLLGFVKPGEHLFIVPLSDGEKHTSGNVLGEEEERSNPQLWMDLFFN